ncbi:serine hydrolase domain-containing protein [Nocardia camponoti]|nr:serine hydrolase domain-containing protein [Nocardia camponoti]
MTVRTTLNAVATQRVMDEIVASGILGLTVRVNDEQGEWVGSAGAAALGEPGEPPVDGHVRIGSNTKTFTATLALQLVAEGKIDLDAPLAGYLPEFGLDERATVRMVLQHTSGIFNFTGEYYEDGTIVSGIAAPGTPLGGEWVARRYESYRPEELVRLALSKPARFEPGTGWSYSNTNYVLARLLIEKVTGRSVAEETRRLIVGPLGLSGTVVPGTSTVLPEPHAHAYYRLGEGEPVDVTEHNPSWISAGGDMISTTADLHTFISALTSGKLLPAPLLSEMFTPGATGIPNMDYGLGVFVVTTEDGKTLISHNGGAAGQAALMYSTLDGRRTLTAALNYVDDSDLSLAVAFQVASQRLVGEVYGGSTPE